MPSTVIVIHGVGDAVPGEAGRAVAEGLGYRVARQDNVYVDGQSLLEFTDLDSGNRVVEVNWADLLRPKATALGVLRHMIYLAAGMLDVAVHAAERSAERWSATVYRFLLLVVTPGAFVCTIATATAVCVENRLSRTVLLTAQLLGSALLTAWARKLGPYFRWLWLWVGVIAIVLVTSLLNTAPLPVEHALVRGSGAIRQVGFACVVLALLGSVLTCWVLRKETLLVRLTRMALLYFPFIAMNILMTLLGCLALKVLSSSPEKYKAWESAVLAWKSVGEFQHADAAREMTDRWALLELAATVAIGGIGVLAILLPVIGYVVEAGGEQFNRKGRGAQNGMALFLAAAPLALLALLVFEVWAVSTAHTNVDKLLNGIPAFRRETLQEVYETSALRVLPYLSWVVGPFALVLKIMGDVCFYLQPDDHHPAAIAKLCRNRLSAALRLAAWAEEGPVVVLAHSQGSRIAADLRTSGKLQCPLLTAGSPVQSLYGRFLGFEIAAEPATDRAMWINCYRDGDVIAGPIDVDHVVNENLGAGWHTNYWSDEGVAKILLRLVSQASTEKS